MKYIINKSDKYDNQQLIEFFQIIPNYKKEKIKKYKNNLTKVNSLIAEIGLKDLLLKDNISYNDISFYINNYGKPYLKNINLFFNISHSFDYSITIISNKEIGIDIEKIRNTSIKVINQFATENEKKYILNSKDKIQENIFKIYTLKEAYFKMKGENLNNILNVEFKICNNNVYCSDKSVKAGFINDLEDYVIAYCEKK